MAPRAQISCPSPEEQGGEGWAPKTIPAPYGALSLVAVEGNWVRTLCLLGSCRIEVAQQQELVPCPCCDLAVG